MERTYRRWVEDQDLISFSVKVGESDLFIRADKQLSQQAEDCLKHQRSLIEDYIRQNPKFAATLKPYAVSCDAPAIIRDMAKAAFSAAVGPMAAVAGALAEYVGEDLLKYSRQVIIENGGDIFLKTLKTRKVGIFAGSSPYTGKLALELMPSDKPLGICTSSGTVGPSLSFGRADAAVAVCASATLADAWATRLGNMVKSREDIEKTLEFVKGQKEIKGVVLIIGDKVGMWGEIRLVRVRS